MTIETSQRMRRWAYVAANLSLWIILLMQCLWLTVWTPGRPDAAWVMIKLILLSLPLRGILRPTIYTYQWSSMLILGFFGDAVMRAWVDHGMASLLAVVELMLAVIFFVAVLCFMRTFPKKPKAAKPDAMKKVDHECAS
jgi:uncharacterized membrane protein